MRVRFTLISALLLFFTVAPVPARAQGTPKDVYYKATVESVAEEGSKTVSGMTLPYQIVTVRILDGNLSKRLLTIEHGTIFSIDKSKFVKPGEEVVVVQTLGPENVPIYQIIDTYRVSALVPFLILFAAAVIILSGWRGLGSIVGMGISLIVIATFIVPRVMAGQDPMTVTVIGCLFILVTTMYLAHGLTKQTTIALVSTAGTLLIIGILSLIITEVTKLSGLGQEDAYSLKLGPAASLNFRGLLLSGMLIGALGVLDDVTTGLSASVFELFHANPRLTFAHLAKAGLRVGREHIASLVNTLVLAYAGASLPIFILLVTNPNGYPLWATINSEMIVEEIVRTLSGSIGLVLAVPLTTFLSSWYLTRNKSR